MSENLFDIHGLPHVVNAGNQSVIVAANIEDRAAFVCVSRVECLFDILEIFPLLPACRFVPCVQRCS
jgi:hypothetical protein